MNDMILLTGKTTTSMKDAVMARAHRLQILSSLDFSFWAFPQGLKIREGKVSIPL